MFAGGSFSLMFHLRRQKRAAGPASCHQVVCSVEALFQSVHNDPASVAFGWPNGRGHADSLRNALMSSGPIAYHAACNRLAGVDAPEFVAVALVERENISGEVGGKDSPSCGGGDSCDDRPRGVAFPIYLGGVRVDGRRPSAPLLDSVSCSEA